MSPGGRDEKAGQPRPGELASLLGRSSALWDELKGHLESKLDPLTHKWNYNGKTQRWSLQLKRKKRTVLYMIPGEGSFVAAFALGEKAAKAAHDAGLPSPLLAVIDGAKKYPEGRAVRIEVRSKRDLGNVQKLAAIKMAN